MGWRRAAVVGASGGIGHALCEHLEQRGCFVHRLSRSGEGHLHIDITVEATIEAAAQALRAEEPLDLVIVASGYLHQEGRGPEKDWRHVTAEELARSFSINAMGPALVAKHFLPLLPDEGRAAFAALSARVGSISDNRLGGWYSYRAGKAALNMIIKTFAVELARKKPHAVCVGLHPGTVDTELSQPFQRNVREGKLFAAEHAASRLLDVLDDLSADDSGKCFAYDGAEIAP